MSSEFRREITEHHKQHIFYSVSESWELLVVLWCVKHRQLFPNREILFDFNEGSSGFFKDHLISYPGRVGPPWADAIVPSLLKCSTW